MAKLKIVFLVPCINAPKQIGLVVHGVKRALLLTDNCVYDDNSSVGTVAAAVKMIVFLKADTVERVRTNAVVRRFSRGNHANLFGTTTIDY